MDEDRLAFWRGDPPTPTLLSAEEAFREAVDKDPVEAFSARASAYHTYAGSCGWRDGLSGLQYWRRSIRDANAAYEKAGADFRKMTINQIDVVTNIWSKAPRLPPFIDLSRRAERALEFALCGAHPGFHSAQPHAVALMRISLGYIKVARRKMELARHQINGAFLLTPSIEAENSDDKWHQLVRVRRDVGLFYFQYPIDAAEKKFGRELFCSALDLAYDLEAHDQVRKIVVLAQKHRFSISE